MDHPLDLALNQAVEFGLGAIKDPDATQRDRWEHKIVGLVLAQFGLQKAAPTLARECIQKFGAYGLRFQTFAQYYPTFPVWLACQKVPYLVDTSVSELFQSMNKTRLWRAYESAEAEAPQEYVGRVVLVSEWLKAIPVLAFHNYYQDPTDVDEPMFTCRIGKGQSSQRFALQSFKSFLSNLKWNG